jgi:hypothetical protein
MLDQIFQTGQSPFRFHHPKLRKLTYVFEIPVSLVGNDRIVGCRVFELIVVVKQLLVDVFGYVFPALVDVGGYTAEV